MEQLQLTSFQKGNDCSLLESFKPYNNTLLRWTYRYPNFDEEKEIETIWDIEITLKEAVIIRKKKTIAGFQFLLIIQITDKTGEMEIDSFIHAEESFEQTERLKAIKEYSSWCAMVWFQWKTIGESRAKILPVYGDEAYICPFCGYASESFFETCNGCGKRFWKPEMWRNLGRGDENVQIRM